MAKGGCNKCTGSCACKAKKPRAKKAPAKRVIGGRVKAPQVVIMPPAVPTAALPTGINPYQTIVSQSTPGVNKSTRGMQTMATETTETKTPSLSEFVSTGSPSFVKGAIKEALKYSRKINPSRLLIEPPKPTLVETEKPPITVTTERRINPSRLLNEPPKPKLVTSVVGTEAKPKTASLKEFISTPSPSLVQGALKYALRPPEPVVKEKPKKSYKSGFMSILPEAIRLENVRQRAIGQKPSMTIMETQTEPLEVKVAKGQRKSIFDVMQEQEETGKTLALTGAGRPTSSVRDTDSGTPPAPVPAPAPATFSDNLNTALSAFTPVLSPRSSSLREFFRSAPAPAPESPE